MKKLNGIVWGIVLVAAGVLLGLNAFGITDIDIFFDGWWTLFIIVPCAVGLVTDRDKFGSLIGICVGVFLLLCCRDVLDFSMVWKLLVPIIVVLIGLKLIIGGIVGERSSEVFKRIRESGGTPKNGTAVFSGSDIGFSGEVFEGARLTAVFGGVDCDLRRDRKGLRDRRCRGIRRHYGHGTRGAERHNSPDHDVRRGFRRQSE